MHEQKARAKGRQKVKMKAKVKVKAKALRKCGADQTNTNPALFIGTMKTVVKKGVMDQSAFYASHIS
jgi:hypothetical protein